MTCAAGRDTRTGASYRLGAPFGHEHAAALEGAPIPEQLHLRAGEGPAAGILAAPAGPLTLLHRDRELAVVAKPAGLVVHPAPLCADRTSCLKLLRDQLGCWVYPAHRLDRATSGVLVFALSRDVASVVGAAFARQAVAKRYLAVVRGFLPDVGSVVKDGEHTDFRALARAELPWPVRPYATSRYTLVELAPLTGRTHQLRRHMAGLAHPIIGDTRYGDGAHNAEFGRRLGTRRLMLHAASLAMRHPATDELCEWRAAPDAAFAAAQTLVLAGPDR